MIIKETYNHTQPREVKETIRFRDGDLSNPKNYIEINIRNNGEIVLSFNPRHLAHASKSVQRKLRPWLISKFGGHPNQKRWNLTEQQLTGFLLGGDAE